MNLPLPFAIVGPEGRQEVARSVRAGTGVFHDPQRSGGPAPSRAAPQCKSRRSLYLLLAFAIAVGVSIPALAQEKAAEKSPAFTATLVRIKADWSEVPAAKEIETDLRTALRGENVDQQVLDNLPAAGAEAIFSPSAAAIYTTEQYRQLLAWLRTKQLLPVSEPFVPGPYPGVSGQGTAAALTKDAEFVEVRSRREPNDPFFSRSACFTWTVVAPAVKEKVWSVVRELRHYEQARGQSEPQPANSNEYDRCMFDFAPLQAGQVLIIGAFPAGQDDWEYQAADKRHGLLTLIVIEHGPTPSEPAVEAKLLLPEKAHRINARRTRGSSSASGWATINPATTPVAGHAATPQRPTWQPPSGQTRTQLEQTSIEELRAIFESKERHAMQLSREIQRLQAIEPRDNKRLKNLNNDLRSAVADSFLANQFLRHKENAEITNRSFRIAQTLEQRFQIADQIIDRRVKDLVNPELKWEDAAKKSGAAVPTNVLKERMELFARLHDDPKWIDNAKDDFRRASSSQERKSALDVELSWRRDIVKALLRLRQLGEQVDADLAAAEAEIQQTEAQMREQEAEPARATDAKPATSEPVVIATAPDVRNSTAKNAEKLTDAEAETIWKVLGVKVRAVTAEESSSDERYAEGAVITEIRPGGPADGMAPLRVNDIIVLLDSWEVISPQRLAFILTQRFTHWSARRSDGVEQLVSTVEAWRGTGSRRTAVQTSLIFSPEEVVAQPQRVTPFSPTPPAAASPMAGGSRPNLQIRTPDDFHRRIQELEGLIQLGNDTVATRFTGKGEEQKARAYQQQHNRNQRDLAFLREEYAAQLRLLQLEVQDAKSAFDTANQQRELLAQKESKDRGSTSRENVLTVERAIEEARLKLQRAETLLDIYRKADPKQPEPEKSKPT